MEGPGPGEGSEDGNACAATSALRASAQIYRSRYRGAGLETGRLLPTIEQAFTVLLDPGVTSQQSGRDASGAA